MPLIFCTCIAVCGKPLRANQYPAKLSMYVVHLTCRQVWYVDASSARLLVCAIFVEIVSLASRMTLDVQTCD